MSERTEQIKSTVNVLSASRRELEIEVSAEEVVKEWDKVLEEYSSRVRVAGFRRGKAPKEMVKRLFYADLKDAVVESLAPRALRESLRLENISPVGTPRINELVFREGEPFRFKAVVEVLPDFDLPAYKRIKVKKREPRIEDAEVAQSLEELRQKSAEYIPVEGRGVAAGDYVVVERKGKDLKTKRYLPTEKVLILAGHPENEKTLNENLIEARPGDVRRFTTSYAADHPKKMLAGRTVEYELKVVSIKERKIPEMTDDWAKDMGEYDSLDALRAKVRQELEKAKEESVRREMGEEVVTSLTAELKIDVPESLVEAEADSILRGWAASLPSRLPADQVEELRKRSRALAERNIKESLLLKKIAAKEEISVTDEEVEEEIKAMARRNNIPLPQLAEKINREGRREDVRNSLLLRKTIDFLLENAVRY
jgi:trigger factor